MADYQVTGDYYNDDIVRCASCGVERDHVQMHWIDRCDEYLCDECYVPEEDEIIDDYMEDEE